MAVSCRPKVLIAHEPTTALDVTVQAQMFDLLNEFQKDFSTAIMLITHDMGAISEMADWVAAMYLGKAVESAPREALFETRDTPICRRSCQQLRF